MSTAQVDTIRPPPSTSAKLGDASAPRKRRKRATAAGASADCFTCSSRSLKCDRRRPYCSQCLDDGRDCSGYKTQLTWGVGVASRGKLRGLSLPVAGTKRIAGAFPPEKTKKRQLSTNSHVHEESNRSTLDKPLATLKSTKLDTDFQNSPPPASLLQPSASHISNDWRPSNYLQQPPVHEQFDPETVNPKPSKSYSSPPDRFVQHGAPDNLAHSTLFQQTQPQYSNHQRLPSVIYTEHSTPRDLFTQAAQPAGIPTSPHSQHFAVYPHFIAPFESTINTHHSFSGYPQPDESFVRGETFEPTPQLYEPAVDPLIRPTTIAIKQEDDDTIEEISRDNMDPECAIVDDATIYSAPLRLDFGSLPLTPSFSSALGIGKTPRMQFLINYYAEVISPVIVAFDGPNNPYRTQILRLAAESETLQHAVSALAASNLRQRRETGELSTGKTDPARRSSMAHLTLSDEEWHSGGLLSPLDQVREETFHKNFAVKSLNQQLADPVARKNDSILAILLVLCLFHVCDSGIAKFQTQFAGVKKLLSLRGNDLRLNNPETKWFTRMFTWFDAMTASVNNREGQLQGAHLDVSALSDEEWSLENLAGCDGELFKTIAKLGRLNVLSQGKSVESNPTLISKPLPSIPFTNGDYNTFDGNGWMRMVADEDLFNARTAEPDLQEQFWREWREIRQVLQTWQLDPTLFSGENPSTPDLTPDQRHDLANISESFRYAALLYTERLANPTAASADGNIAAWVRQGLHFIKQVKSDVYLLWPLFIVGSECVDSADIDVIRIRCLDIQKDSGFLNNKSTLDLLEKIWAANVSGEGSQPQTGFRFSRIMELEGNEGEYIVV